MNITGRTRVLGLIGDPVVQARSPGMANALLQQRERFDACRSDEHDARIHGRALRTRLGDTALNRSSSR
jgi:shikimate 5-dehydrogenase